MIGRERPADPPYLISYAPRFPEPGLGYALKALDEGERVKASRFRSAHDQRRFIWRRYLRRHLLAELLGVAPKALVFATACPRCGSRAHGKPYLADAPHLHFSAAQSEHHTAVAVGPAPFGIDIQEPLLPDEAPGVFMPSEQASVAAEGPDADRHRAVLWTRKEAYLKALGRGLSIDPVLVDARAAGFADGVFGGIEAPGQALWSTASWTLPGAVVAIACAKPSSSVRLAEVVATADPPTGSLTIRSVKTFGYEGEMGMTYASSGASGGADLSRGR